MLHKPPAPLVERFSRDREPRTPPRDVADDDHLALMLASEPGTVLSDLTLEGLPRIIRFANAFLAPLADAFLPRSESRGLIDVLARRTRDDDDSTGDSQADRAHGGPR